MRLLAAALFAMSVLVAPGCTRSGSDARPTIVASFYPLAWAAERVAGHDYRVVNLTPPGVEPHDIELTPSDVQTIDDAQLVVYVGAGSNRPLRTPSRPVTGARSMCCTATRIHTSGWTRFDSHVPSPASLEPSRTSPRRGLRSVGSNGSTPNIASASESATAA